MRTLQKILVLVLVVSSYFSIHAQKKEIEENETKPNKIIIAKSQIIEFVEQIQNTLKPENKELHDAFSRNDKEEEEEEEEETNLFSLLIAKLESSFLKKQKENNKNLNLFIENSGNNYLVEQRMIGPNHCFDLQDFKQSLSLYLDLTGGSTQYQTPEYIVLIFQEQFVTYQSYYKNAIVKEPSICDQLAEDCTNIFKTVLGATIVITLFVTLFFQKHEEINQTLTQEEIEQNPVLMLLKSLSIGLDDSMCLEEE